MCDWNGVIFFKAAARNHVAVKAKKASVVATKVGIYVIVFTGTGAIF